MSHLRLFDDKTILSTPKPVHSSSMSSEKDKKEKAPPFDTNYDSSFDMDNSLGILSIKSGDLTPRESSAALFRQQELSKAKECLTRTEPIFAIPSPYLKRPEKLEQSTLPFCDTSSTISESDLLPGNCSTPRTSSSNPETPWTAEFAVRERPSMGKTITSLASSMADPEVDFDKFLNTIQKSMAEVSLKLGELPAAMRSKLEKSWQNEKASSLTNFDIDDYVNAVQKSINDGSFKSGESAAALLAEGEKSWKREKGIPAETKEFSINSADNMKMSIGSFFKQRSDDLPNLLIKSPEKHFEPIPLIETSSNQTRKSSVTEEGNKSVSLSLIQKALSSEESPNAVMNNLLKNTKKSKKSLEFQGRKSENQFKAPPAPPKNECKNQKKTRKSLERKSDVHEFKTPLVPSKNTKKPRKSLEKREKKSDEFEFKPPPTPSNAECTVKFDFVEEIPEEVKENLSPYDGNRSGGSARSSSSLSVLPNGKLPIATTKPEVIWGCVRPGKHNSQEFVIRNRSPNRVGITCTVTNPAFRLHKDGSELNFLSVLKIVLHPYESRPLLVSFAPTSVGAVVDNINFTPLDPRHLQTTKQFIKLYGYGGCGDITVRKISKDTTGKYLCSLGSIDEPGELKRTFSLMNSGTLPAFVFFKFTSNCLYSFSNIEIEPLIAVLMPGEERDIVVKCNLSKKDIYKFKIKSPTVVFEMGKLLMIHGTEVDRARLRKLCQKAEEKQQEMKPYILELVETFPGEVPPNDLKYFRESISMVDDLMEVFTREEITITIEQKVDGTVTTELHDETSMYQSLCEQTHFLDCVACQVEPSKIFLTPPEKTKDIIFVTNWHKKTIYFETNVAPEGLQLKPHDGIIKPGENVMIELSCKQNASHKTAFKVRILVDNDSYDVDVKVVFINKA